MYKIAFKDESFANTIPMKDLNLSWVEECKSRTNNIIAIEGPDGVGKTSICKTLQNRGYSITRGVPSEWEQPQIKSLMIGTDCWLASAFYFLSGVIMNDYYRRRNVKNELYAFSDRSIWSSFVVHYKKNANLLPELCNLLAIVAPHVHFPKQIIVLDAGYENTVERIKNKPRIEQAYDYLLPRNQDVYNREIFFFQWLNQLGLNVIFIDASLEINKITENILYAIKHDKFKTL